MFLLMVYAAANLFVAVLLLQIAMRAKYSRMVLDVFLYAYKATSRDEIFSDDRAGFHVHRV